MRKLRVLPRKRRQTRVKRALRRLGARRALRRPRKVEKRERIVLLLISSQPPHLLRRAQVSVTMAEKTPREGRTSDLAYS